MLEEVECIFLQIIQEIKAGKGLNFDVPSRSRSNQLYVPELDRIVLRDSILHRSFGSAATNFKTVLMTRVLQQVMELCLQGISTTKRDLFYTDVKLFKVYRLPNPDVPTNLADSHSYLKLQALHHYAIIQGEAERLRLESECCPHRDGERSIEFWVCRRT